MLLHVEHELLTLPEYLSSPPVFSWINVARSLVFCVVFCRWLFVFLSIFLCPLCCLPFFNLRLPQTFLKFLSCSLHPWISNWQKNHELRIKCHRNTPTMNSSGSQKIFEMSTFCIYSHFDSKIFFFYNLFYWSYFHYHRLNSYCSSKNNRKDKEFDCNFLTICRYLNLLKNRG